MLRTLLVTFGLICTSAYADIVQTDHTLIHSNSPTSGLEFMQASYNQDRHYCDVYYDLYGSKDNSLNACTNYNEDMVNLVSTDDGWRIATANEFRDLLMAFSNIHVFNDHFWGLNTPGQPGGNKQSTKDTLAALGTEQQSLTMYVADKTDRYHQWVNVYWLEAADFVGGYHSFQAGDIRNDSVDSKDGVLLVRDWDGTARNVFATSDVSSPSTLVALLPLLLIGVRRRLVAV